MSGDHNILGSDAVECGMLAPPFGLGVVSEALLQYSCWLALRKGFRYDYEQREASWSESGERRNYKHTA